MKTLSPLLKKFCSHWGSNSPEFAIVQAVKATFPELKDASPPIDPFRLALHRKVKEIISADIKADGEISLTSDSSYVIHLNAKHPETRKRFTVGHEIGHTLFFDLEGQTGSRFRVVDAGVDSLLPDWGEEYLCNVASAEILMPFISFSARMRNLPPTTKTILQLSKEFNISLQATARRVVQLSSFKLMVCMWEYKPAVNCYETLWVAKPYSTRGSIHDRFFVTSDQPIFKAFTEESFRGRKWVSLDGPLDHYFVDGLTLGGQGKRLLTVFILETIAERLVGRPSFDDAAFSRQERLF